MASTKRNNCWSKPWKTRVVPMYSFSLDASASNLALWQSIKVLTGWEVMTTMPWSCHDEGTVAKFLGMVAMIYSLIMLWSTCLPRFMAWSLYGHHVFTFFSRWIFTNENFGFLSATWWPTWPVAEGPSLPSDRVSKFKQRWLKKCMEFFSVIIRQQVLIIYRRNILRKEIHSLSMYTFPRCFANSGCVNCVYRCRTWLP